MKKINLKKESGVAGTDALIAVMIIVLFTGLIATISYNIFLSNSSLKRMSRANSFIVDVFEFVDRSYYDDVTKASLEELFDKYNSENNKEVIALAYIEGEEPDKNENDYKNELNGKYRYKVLIKIDKYNKDNRNRPDLVEEITVKVLYKLNGKDQEIEMKHTKSRESLKTPNPPNFKSLDIRKEYNVYPVKKLNDTLTICDKNDSDWYDYKQGRWAFVIEVESEMNVGDEISINELSENDRLYAWIPRYAINENEGDIIFLFSTSNQYIDNTDVRTIDELYSVPDQFNNIDGIWVEDKVYMTFDDGLYGIYPYK